MLADADATPAQVWSAYEALQQPQQQTVADVIDAYFRSPQFTALAAVTQAGYRTYAVKLHAVFGAMAPDSVTSPHVQRYLDARAHQPTAANHERALLSLLFNWGKARGYCRIANPVDAVRPLKVAPGGRYVSHDEYFAFYDFLLERGHPMHAAAMGIAYLCGARQQDVLRLLRERPVRPAADDCWVAEAGLVIWQAKTGKVQLKEWTDDLRLQVALALEADVRIGSPYVLRGRGGLGFTRGGFNSSWTRCQQAALESGVLQQRFRFHDLKVKALSDYGGADRAHFSGHATRGMAERYNRTPDRVAALRLPARTTKR